MNKNIKLAVAGAVLALSATAANAGIIIPAGEWTLDVNGNVNAFANYTHADAISGTYTTTSGLAATPNTSNTKYGSKYQGINTGLLPSWLGFTGTTRQNDIDVSFTISMQPNVSDNTGAGDNKTPLFRQTFLTFGDKSWGSIKLGKDIGIFASDAILNDMTLLGVGAGAVGAKGASGNATSLGGIGTGYIYAAWKGQIAYTTPNFNGFQATVGITNPDQISANATTGVSSGNQDRFGVEGKASYSFNQNDVSGKVWVSGATYDVNLSSAVQYTVSAADIGATVNAGGFGLTGYYYTGKGAGATILGADGLGGGNARRDSDGGYVQLTYVTPFKTKLGAAYGISNLDTAGSDNTSSSAILKSNERYTLGAYHPLTKHLNLVAEYNNVQSEVHSGGKAESSTYSAGAILFF
jgi:predicted porin